MIRTFLTIFCVACPAMYAFGLDSLPLRIGCGIGSLAILLVVCFVNARLEVEVSDGE